MKKTLLLMTLVLAWGLSAWALPTPCLTGTLASYETAGFSCTIGDLTFSDFDYASAASGATAPDPAGVTVTPVLTGFGAYTGLLFTASWSVNSGQTEDSTIFYDVSTSTPGITSLDLAMIGSTDIGMVGSASVSESSFVPPSFSLGVTPIAPVNFENFPPSVTSLSLAKAVDLSGGSSGSASVGDVFNLFEQAATTVPPVPEPSLLFLSAGLLGLIPIARRKLVR